MDLGANVKTNAAQKIVVNKQNNLQIYRYIYSIGTFLDSLNVYWNDSHVSPIHRECLQ